MPGAFRSTRSTAKSHAARHCLLLRLTRNRRPGPIADAKWVAGRFEISRRRENLTWSHHREVAGIEDDAEHDAVLDAAATGGWSKKRLRSEVRHCNAARRASVNRSAPPTRAQLFGGLMAFETSGGFRRLGSKAQARSGIQVPQSSPPIPPEILHSAISARVPPNSNHGRSGTPGLRCRIHPSAAIPVVQLKARSGSLGSGGTRARAAEAIFGARSPAHPRPGASGAGRLAKFRISPIFSQPRRADYRRRPVSVDRAAPGSASRCGPARRRDR